MMNIIKSKFDVFNNGPALFEQLDHPEVKKYIKETTEYEEKSDFFIQRYWNRRWEYPFILKVCDSLKNNLQTLDAGAGKSLMPFMIEKRNNMVDAVDIDNGSFYPKDSLNNFYDVMNDEFNTNVNFINGDLRMIDCRSDYYDFVYSISVLEHIENPLSVLVELWRVLKPGGVIALTIDLSLDNTRSMYKEDYHKILSFLSANGLPLFPERLEFNDGLITTNWFKINDPYSLPWAINYSGLSKIKKIVKNFLKGKWDLLGKPYGTFSSLVVVGLAYQKTKNVKIVRNYIRYQKE